MTAVAEVETKFERQQDGSLIYKREPKPTDPSILRTAQNNVHIFERICTKPRQTGTDPMTLAVRMAPGVPREEAEKMLLERIESAKAKYGKLVIDADTGEERCVEPAVLTFARVGLKEGWVIAESVYASRQKPLEIHAVVHADGSVEGY